MSRSRLNQLAMAVAACLVGGLHGLNCYAQANARSSEWEVKGTTEPPRTWITDVVANQVRVVQHDGSYLRYSMHVVDRKGDTVRDVIETRDGTVARQILRDGRPLSPEQDAAERERLNGELASPAELAKHLRNDAQGKKLAVEMIRLMPDAMIYSYAPGQPQWMGAPERKQIVLDYKPNPEWKAPSTTAEALTGLEGRMWVDAKSHELLRIEGQIFQGVNFGWGMLAYIYPGARVVLEQTEVAGGRWIFTHFAEDAKVRALMVRTLDVHTIVEASGFQVLHGSMSSADAIRTLLSTPLPQH